MFIDEKKIIEGNESEDVAHLTHVDDRVSDAILSDILKDNGIPFMRKERSAGIGSSVIAGYCVFGVDFYVSREKLEEAKELYNAFLCAEQVFDTDTEND